MGGRPSLAQAFCSMRSHFIYVSLSLKILEVSAIAQRRFQPL